jgi:PPP family 3-phenylpropionic acid transporter
VACNQSGYYINYGAARGLGSVASGTSALVLGYIIARLGTSWMFLFLIAFRLICMVAVLGFPRLEKQVSRDTADQSCTIAQFFLRYKWYCLSLLGIGFLGMFHSMTENYMIVIMERFGGNSSHVGTALFISSLSGAPVIFFFRFFHKRIRETSLLKISALTFLLKSVLFCFAPAIGYIYLFQTLQATSYGFLGPTQVYFAGNRVKPADMIKGQAFIATAYSLGCSAGNFAGGQLLNFGVNTMLIGGVVMALLGTVVLFFTVNKSDI